MSKVGDGITAKSSSWTFGGKTSKKFKDHITRSVPYYKEGQILTSQFSEFFISKNDIVYDLGCSTGDLTSKIYDKNKDKKPKIIGIDIEKNMIKQAKIDNKRKGITYLCRDINNFKFKKSNFITSYYTIQFIKPSRRQKIFDKIYKSLNWGGGFIFFEKVRAPDVRFQDYVNQLYYDFKISNGFTEKEIIAKTKSLKGVLEPFTSSENLKFLKRAGFVDFVSIQKNLNFEGFLAIK